MQKQRSLSGFTATFWKRLGLDLAELADAIWLGGVVKASSKVVTTVLSTVNQPRSPLDWNYPINDLYVNEQSILWVADSCGKRTFLPQAVLINSGAYDDEGTIGIRLEPIDFYSNCPVRDGFKFYERVADSFSRQFFDAENARLVDWDESSQTLIFQGCSYFDYLQTNLSLDLPQYPLGSLREQLVNNGRLESLCDSRLANATGVNSLIFSNDGYMVFQKRRENVLVRPGELCSGFSGTIDKIDIQHAVGAGGVLSQLDVPREMVEELGVNRSEITSRCFLGITRELIRGGAPEIFYAIDVNLRGKEILSRIPKDKEGDIHLAYFGHYATSTLQLPQAEKLPSDLARLLEDLHVKGKAPLSIPFITNLVLWFQKACPGYSGTGEASRGSSIYKS